ncbi:hypothetical protein [Streptomyces sp. NPDC086519]|uniref:hypothetical protein n=1 Tax=Streptomyces sp. NPDC086519 TaxID=3154863 RepID=UPI00344797D4
MLGDRTRVLGPNHPGTLTTRLAIRVAAFGRDHPGTLKNRFDVAAMPGKAGQARQESDLRFAIAGLMARSSTDRALQLLSDLLKDQIRVLGLTHQDTSATGQLIRALTEKKRRRS